MTSSPFILRHYAELDSTNEEAKRLLAQGEITEPTILRADCQTAGKGTQGRQWFSPPGAGLYFSVVHPFHGEDGQFAQLSEIPLTPLFTLAAGVACAETLASLTGLTIQLKPINDLYMENRKLGGILTESLISENRCRALITGIGINVREHAEVLDGCRQEDRGHQPISLQACIGPQVFTQWHPDALLAELSESIAETLNQRYRQLAAGQIQLLQADYLRFKLPEIDLPGEVEAVLGAGF